MAKEIIHDVCLFVDGVASVCDDPNIIAEKALARFGKKHKRVVQYVLLMKTMTLSAKQFAEILSLRDFSEGLYEIEAECAKRNGLVIVYGYSDDVIELAGAIRTSGDCFQGGDFHLVKNKGCWKLADGVGKCNNISALWYSCDAVNDCGECIPWSYKTDIACEKFYVTRDGDPYCEGFVFSKNDLKRFHRFATPKTLAK